MKAFYISLITGLIVNSICSFCELYGSWVNIGISAVGIILCCWLYWKELRREKEKKATERPVHAEPRDNEPPPLSDHELILMLILHRQLGVKVPHEQLMSATGWSDTHVNIVAASLEHRKLAGRGLDKDSLKYCAWLLYPGSKHLDDAGLILPSGKLSHEAKALLDSIPEK